MYIYLQFLIKIAYILINFYIKFEKISSSLFEAVELKVEAKCK